MADAARLFPPHCPRRDATAPAGPTSWPRSTARRTWSRLRLRRSSTDSTASRSPSSSRLIPARGRQSRSTDSARGDDRAAPAVRLPRLHRGSPEPRSSSPTRVACRRRRTGYGRPLRHCPSIDRVGRHGASWGEHAGRRRSGRADGGCRRGARPHKPLALRRRPCGREDRRAARRGLRLTEVVIRLARAGAAQRSGSTGGRYDCAP